MHTSPHLYAPSLSLLKSIQVPHHSFFPTPIHLLACMPPFIVHAPLPVYAQFFFVQIIPSSSLLPYLPSMYTSFSVSTTYPLRAPYPMCTLFPVCAALSQVHPIALDDFSIHALLHPWVSS